MAWSSAKSPPTTPSGRSGCWPRRAPRSASGAATRLQRCSAPQVSMTSTSGGCSGSPRSPAGPRGGYDTLAGGMVHAVFRQAAHPLLAAQLIARAVAPAALAEMATTTGQLPRGARRSASSTEPRPCSPTQRRCSNGPPCARSRRVTRVSAQLQSMLEAVLVGRLTPAEAASRTADMIGAITGLDVVH